MNMLSRVEGLIILLLCLRVEFSKGVTNFQNLMTIWRHYSGQLMDGNSSYYGYYQGGGACSLDPLTSDYSHKGWIKVAAGDGEFQKSLGCGMCVEITGQGILAELAVKGRIPKTPIIGPIYAFVIDRCGNCKQGFDLYAPGSDQWKTQFKAIDCPRVAGINGNIKFRFVDSNPWAMKLQTRNSRVVTVGLEISHNGKWICLPRTDDNYFLMGSRNRIQFPLQVRLTSVSGEQVESTITELKNGVDITSSVQFSGFIKGSDPRAIKCYGQGPALGSNDEDMGDDTFCKGKQDGYYLDPKDCAAFYQCSRGSAFRKHCLRGQVFNDILKTCDSPMNFPCRQRSLISVLGPSKERTVQPVVNPITQHDQPELSQSTLQKVDDTFCNDKFDGFFEDPNNCTVFYQCLKGKATKRHCLKGMVFNPLLKTCDTPQDFPCRTAGGVDGVQIENNTPEVKPSPRKELNSDGGQSLINLAASAKPGINGMTPVKPPVVKSEDNANGVIVDKEFCLDRSNGNYADPYDCSGFYTCTEGETIKESCPRRLKYNYSTGECDWPFNVKCTTPPPYKPARRRKVFMYKTGEDKAMTIHGLITRITAVAKKRTIHKGYKDKEDNTIDTK
ncbi:hypothetical protein ACROYT_G040607 [Oculina patagonica]